MKTEEWVGQPLIGNNAEAVKNRASAYDQVKQIFEEYDSSDPEHFVCLLMNDKGALMADEEHLPNVIYGLGKLLSKAVEEAKASSNPITQISAMAALASSLDVDLNSSSDTERGQDNENDNDRISD